MAARLSCHFREVASTSSDSAQPSAEEGAIKDPDPNGTPLVVGDATCSGTNRGGVHGGGCMPERIPGREDAIREGKLSIQCPRTSLSSSGHHHDVTADASGTL